MLALQTELVKGSPAALKASVTKTTARHLPTTQRTLLSSNFNPLQGGARAAGALGRGVMSAGDQLRNLIVPDALAAVVTAPTWIPGIGAGKRLSESDGGKKAEKMRGELEDILASSCPLCESVVVGLDKPFLKDGEVDTTWAL